MCHSFVPYAAYHGRPGPASTNLRLRDGTCRHVRHVVRQTQWCSTDGSALDCIQIEPGRGPTCDSGTGSNTGVGHRGSTFKNVSVLREGSESSDDDHGAMVSGGPARQRRGRAGSVAAHQAKARTTLGHASTRTARRRPLHRRARDGFALKDQRASDNKVVAIRSVIDAIILLASTTSVFSVFERDDLLNLAILYIMHYKARDADRTLCLILSLGAHRSYMERAIASSAVPVSHKIKYHKLLKIQ